MTLPAALIVRAARKRFARSAFGRRNDLVFRNRDSPVLDYAPILVHRDDRAAYDKKIHIDRTR